MGARKKWRVVLALCAAGLAGAWAISGWPGGAQPACRGGRGLSLAEFHEQTAMAPEDVMYRQPYAVERALELLAPQRPGKTDLYYVGFAGDGKEDVFTNDVQLAQKALAPYGAAGHTLLLQNHVESVYDTPIADAANLEAALQGLARRMDTREDVLFLFLSSHGAYDHELSVDFPPLQLRDLSAEHLKAMLDKSGIRYRVIVVSACYSGGFLDVLKDDNTLVLTASSRDHEAYGCGDVTKYTEFTAAYFGQALQHRGDVAAHADLRVRRILALALFAFFDHAARLVERGNEGVAVRQRVHEIRFAEIGVLGVVAAAVRHMAAAGCGEHQRIVVLQHVDEAARVAGRDHDHAVLDAVAFEHGLDCLRAQIVQLQRPLRDRESMVLCPVRTQEQEQHVLVLIHARGDAGERGVEVVRIG